MEEKKDKKTFKELWANTRTRALIKLGMWFAFFILIFLILAIASLFSGTSLPKEDVKQQEVVTANIPAMLENLIASNYTFEYKITNNDFSYSYIGSRENGEIKGYYENLNGIIKYTIKDNIYYELNNNELIENNEIISQEDKNILDLNNLLVTIKNYELENEVLPQDNVYTYDILNNDVNYQIKITTKSSDIETIVINYSNVNYELIFKNVESVIE